MVVGLDRGRVAKVNMWKTRCRLNNVDTDGVDARSVTDISIVVVRGYTPECQARRGSCLPWAEVVKVNAEDCLSAEWFVKEFLGRHGGAGGFAVRWHVIAKRRAQSERVLGSKRRWKKGRMWMTRRTRSGREMRSWRFDGICSKDGSSYGGSLSRGAERHGRIQSQPEIIVGVGPVEIGPLVSVGGSSRR